MIPTASLIGIDLFAGAGGMSLGAKTAGIPVSLAVESDQRASRTYAANHPETRLFPNDIRALQPHLLTPFKRVSHRLIVFGGPPCQGFSWSNVRTRNTANPTNWLFREFLRIVRLLEPTWLIFENVQGIVNTARGRFLHELRSALEPHYVLHQALLNSVHYGVPQSRTRLFLVGCREGYPFSFPSPSSSTPLTVDEAIRDLPPLPNGNSASSLPYGFLAPSHYARAMRGRRHACRNHLVTRNAPFVLTRYRHVPPGGNWQDIPASLMTNYRDRNRCHTGLYHRLRADQPSVVIGNYRKNMLIHPSQDRGLSVREAARLQSFPDSYELFDSIGFQQQQIGNAVPPLLARAVFSEVLRSHKRWAA